MRRLFLIWLFVCPGLGSFITSLSHAQDPAEVLNEYRLIPPGRLSRLFTTGHEGPNVLYQLSGKYDFRHNTGWPIKASFDNAEIWGAQLFPWPAPPIVFDIDELLNLEGLSGEALPVMAPFDIYRFEGDTSDGSSVELFAAVLGPWMYVRGDTEPPPNVDDFPTHRFHWLARSKPFADPNRDGVVNAADYVSIRKAEARGVRIGGEYDDIGFAEWSQQFGESVPDVSAIDSMMSSALASMVPAAAPEPGSASLALFSAVLMATTRRRRDYASGRVPG